MSKSTLMLLAFLAVFSILNSAEAMKRRSPLAERYQYLETRQNPLVTTPKTTPAPLVTTPGTSAPITTGGNPKTSAGGQCQCTYASRQWQGGCKISVPAPPDNACTCIFDGSQCTAKTIKCPWNLESKECKNPDTSKASCFLGGGHCGGYY